MLNATLLDAAGLDGMSRMQEEQEGGGGLSGPVRIRGSGGGEVDDDFNRPSRSGEGKSGDDDDDTLGVD